MLVFFFNKMFWLSVVLMYLRIWCKVLKWGVLGDCINWLRSCIEKDKLGLVCVKKFNFLMKGFVICGVW